MSACLSEKPGDRPSFAQLAAIFEDLKAELASGTYINTNGNVQVCSRPHSSFRKRMQDYYLHLHPALSNPGVHA
jgi:hypothetical protein